MSKAANNRVESAVALAQHDTISLPEQQIGHRLEGQGFRPFSFEHSHRPSAVLWPDDQADVAPNSTSEHGINWIRIFDVVFALTALLLAWPLLLVLALAVKVTSPGPIFYGSERIGHSNSAFNAWKFRSMKLYAEEVLADTLAADDALRAEYEEFNKLRNDPRLTPIGSFIRKTSLDELPQLFNVLKGEMSVIGPRPKLLHEVDYYGAMLPLVLSLKPGLTGLWQVSGRNNLTMEERVAIDVRYVLGRSAIGDFRILLRTLAVLCRPAKYGAV